MEYFPSRRNLLPTHLTSFHQLLAGENYYRRGYIKSVQTARMVYDGYKRVKNINNKVAYIINRFKFTNQTGYGRMLPFKTQYT